MSNRHHSPPHARLSRLEALQVKYESVLAENEQLYHDLRSEQTRRAKYESAYRRIQEDVNRDQDALRRLFVQTEQGERHRETQGRDELTRNSAPSDGLVEDKRIYQLERNCAYLQAKVESLHKALRRFEDQNAHDGDDPRDRASLSARSSSSAASVLSAPRERLPKTNLDGHTEDFHRLSPVPSLASEALRAEQTCRLRAEEQLTHCHAVLCSLREDAAHKEALYYQQLASLQEENTALLEDVEMWVRGAATVTARDSGAVTEVRQWRKMIQAQAAALTQKEEMICQLQARVTELEVATAASEKFQEITRTPPTSSSLSVVPIRLKGLLALWHDAQAVEAYMPRDHTTHSSTKAAAWPSLSPPRSTNDANITAEEDTPALMLAEVQRVLRQLLKVLSSQPQSSPPSAPSASPEPEPAPRARPSTVLHTATTKRPYRSGETLSEAAQTLANLMRRYPSS